MNTKNKKLLAKIISWFFKIILGLMWAFIIAVFIVSLFTDPIKTLGVMGIFTGIAFIIIGIHYLFEWAERNLD